MNHENMEAVKEAAKDLNFLRLDEALGSLIDYIEKLERLCVAMYQTGGFWTFEDSSRFRHTFAGRMKELGLMEDAMKRCGNCCFFGGDGRCFRHNYKYVSAISGSCPEYEKEGDKQ